MNETQCLAKWRRGITDDRPEEAMTDRGRTQLPPRPRWVKNLLLALLVVALVAILVMLLFGGEHGPGRHQSIEGSITPYASAAGHR